MASSPARRKTLGRTGAPIAPLGFGLAALSMGYGPAPPDAERLAVLDRARELGATFWDTSDIYGDSESLLGRWFARSGGGRREGIFLASKFGLKVDAEGKGLTVDSSEGWCRRACEASLGRLGCGWIDLYYAHRLNAETPVEETMRAMVRLKEEGKIRHIGLSGVSAATLRRACKIAQVDAVQMEYSPFVLDIERSSGVLAACRELGISVICYSPLGRGMLTDTFLSKEIQIGPTDSRSRYPRFNDENFETNAKAVRQFKEFADKKGCTAPQLALAWLLKQGDDIIPIPGTKKAKYLEDNWGALNVSLTDDDEKEIRQFLENVQIQGDNIMTGGSAFAFQDTVEEQPVSS